jgi:Ca-activated chloride channel family protein
MLDVWLQLAPPVVERPAKRPDLNVGIVLDRSGSMAEAGKMSYAREAAVFVAQELLETDWFSLTIFDHHIETLVPSTRVRKKASLIAAIRQVHPRGSTALHAGWMQGAEQVEQRLARGALNRVLLLTDGLANVGEINSDVIANDVARFRERGVGTSTFGLGDAYNQDLLEAMAAAGDGNYYYIDSPQRLPNIFQSELHGLFATVGEDVRLRIAPAPGVALLDVMNDFEVNEAGEHQLPNLVTGMPIEALVRLRVAPASGPDRREVCDFAVTWSSPDHVEQQLVKAGLSLPVVSPDVWFRLAPNTNVEEVALSLAVARLKKQYAQSVDARDLWSAKQWLAEARNLLDQSPNSSIVDQEREMLAALERDLEEGRAHSSSRRARYEYYRRRRSKPVE